MSERTLSFLKLVLWFEYKVPLPKAPVFKFYLLLDKLDRVIGL